MSELPDFFGPHIEDSTNSGYQIKLIVSTEKNNRIEYKNEFVVPTVYETIKEAQFHIIMDVEHRLLNTMYFRSQKKGYDLVRYSREALVNTYLAYRIIPIVKKKTTGLKTKT